MNRYSIIQDLNIPDPTFAVAPLERGHTTFYSDPARKIHREYFYLMGPLSLFIFLNEKKIIMRTETDNNIYECNTEIMEKSIIGNMNHSSSESERRFGELVGSECDELIVGTGQVTPFRKFHYRHCESQDP